MAFEFNDLKGFVFLVLVTMPVTLSTNINCNGKPFHCINSTHFMICVDVGGGTSSTIDDFLIACPPTTECRDSNQYECEFPIVSSTPSPPVTNASTSNDIYVLPPLIASYTKLPTNANTKWLLTENNTVSPVSKNKKSLNKVEILEEIKEEFTDGKEKVFESATPMPESRISYNAEQINATIINTNGSIPVLDIKYNTGPTTEMMTITNASAIPLKDNLEVINIAGILLDRGKTNYNSQFTKVKNESIGTAIGAEIMTTSSSVNTEHRVDLDKPPDSTKINSSVQMDSSGFNYKSTMSNTEISTATEVLIDDLNTTEKLLIMQEAHVKPNQVSLINEVVSKVNNTDLANIVDKNNNTHQQIFTKGNITIVKMLAANDSNILTIPKDGLFAIVNTSYSSQIREQFNYSSNNLSSHATEKVLLSEEINTTNKLLPTVPYVVTDTNSSIINLKIDTKYNSSTTSISRNTAPLNDITTKSLENEIKKEEININNFIYTNTISDVDATTPFTGKPINNINYPQTNNLFFSNNQDKYRTHFQTTKSNIQPVITSSTRKYEESTIVNNWNSNGTYNTDNAYDTSHSSSDHTSHKSTDVTLTNDFQGALSPLLPINYTNNKLSDSLSTNAATDLPSIDLHLGNNNILNDSNKFQQDEIKYTFPDTAVHESSITTTNPENSNQSILVTANQSYIKPIEAEGVVNDNTTLHIQYIKNNKIKLNNKINNLRLTDQSETTAEVLNITVSSYVTTEGNNIETISDVSKIAGAISVKNVSMSNFTKNVKIGIKPKEDNSDSYNITTDEVNNKTFSTVDVNANLSTPLIFTNVILNKTNLMKLKNKPNDNKKLTTANEPVINGTLLELKNVNTNTETASTLLLTTMLEKAASTFKIHPSSENLATANETEVMETTLLLKNNKLPFRNVTTLITDEQSKSELLATKSTLLLSTILDKELLTTPPNITTDLAPSNEIFISKNVTTATGAPLLSEILLDERPPKFVTSVSLLDNLLSGINSTTTLYPAQSSTINQTAIKPSTPQLKTTTKKGTLAVSSRPSTNMPPTKESSIINTTRTEGTTPLSKIVTETHSTKEVTTEAGTLLIKYLLKYRSVTLPIELTKNKSLEESPRSIIRQIKGEPRSTIYERESMSVTTSTPLIATLNVVTVTETTLLSQTTLYKGTVRKPIETTTNAPFSGQLSVMTATLLPRSTLLANVITDDNGITKPEPIVPYLVDRSAMNVEEITPSSFLSLNESSFTSSQKPTTNVPTSEKNSDANLEQLRGVAPFPPKSPANEEILIKIVSPMTFSPPLSSMNVIKITETSPRTSIDDGTVNVGRNAPPSEDLSHSNVVRGAEVLSDTTINEGKFTPAVTMINDAPETATKSVLEVIKVKLPQTEMNDKTIDKSIQSETKTSLTKKISDTNTAQSTTSNTVITDESFINLATIAPYLSELSKANTVALKEPAGGLQTITNEATLEKSFRPTTSLPPTKNLTEIRKTPLLIKMITNVDTLTNVVTAELSTINVENLTESTLRKNMTDKTLISTTELSTINISKATKTTLLSNSVNSEKPVTNTATTASYEKDVSSLIVTKITNPKLLPTTVVAKSLFTEPSRITVNEKIPLEESSTANVIAKVIRTTLLPKSNTENIHITDNTESKKNHTLEYSVTLEGTKDSYKGNSIITDYNRQNQVNSTEILKAESNLSTAIETEIEKPNNTKTTATSTLNTKASTETNFLNLEQVTPLPVTNGQENQQSAPLDSTPKVIQVKAVYNSSLWTTPTADKIEIKAEYNNMYNILPTTSTISKVTTVNTLNKVLYNITADPTLELPSEVEMINLTKSQSGKRSITAIRTFNAKDSIQPVAQINEKLKKYTTEYNDTEGSKEEKKIPPSYHEISSLNQHAPSDTLSHNTEYDSPTTRSSANIDQMKNSELQIPFFEDSTAQIYDLANTSIPTPHKGTKTTNTGKVADVKISNEKVATTDNNLQYYSNTSPQSVTHNISYQVNRTSTIFKTLISNKTALSYTDDSMNKLALICRNHSRGKYADSKDCRKFYICIGNLQPIVGTCPNNTVFSEINKQCTRNLSHCVRNNQFHCLYEGRFIDFIKDNVYYICIKNNLHGFYRYKLQCQNDYYLNKASVKCEKKINTFQSASVKENYQINSEKNGFAKKSDESENSQMKTIFECNKEGKFPYSEDCRKYYVCSKNKKSEYRRKLKTCSSDEFYDKEKKKCVGADSSNEC